MGLFGFGKKRKIIDLSNRVQENGEGVENYEDSLSPAESSEESKDESVDLTQSTEKKKKSFAKRISGMIETLDNLSTKIYHLEQRLEVLEKKLRINNFD